MFQSTRPAQGATLGSAGAPRSTPPFQSTRPAQGATSRRGHVAAGGVVSIHAPRAGRDTWTAWTSTTGGRFNPRAPRRARRLDHPHRRHEEAVSIHAPRAGRDTCALWRPMGTGLFQSTRPAQGATPLRWRARRHPRRFNPRAPRRARPRPPRGPGAGGGFNPRAPRRARRHAVLVHVARGRVSIHAPRAGRDVASTRIFRRLFAFQSTRPAQGATTGRSRPSGRSWSFNPRAPRRARLQNRNPTDTLNYVSIHAPRAGRDHYLSPIYMYSKSFNPRAPRRARPSIHTYQ